MVKTLAALLLATLGCAQAQSLTRHVDPFIGTDGTGHVAPGATVPFGMVFPSPDNADRGWSFSGGYQYRAPRIMGFSNTHMSGVGIGDLGDVLLQPSQGQRWTAATTDFSSSYDKQAERARPGYYAVTLKDLGVRVDLTATERVAFQRYTFTRPGRVQVLVDLQHGILFGDGPRVTQSQHAVDAARGEIVGTVHAKNWVERQTSFIVRFSQAIAEKTVLPPREGDKAPRLLLSFDLGKGQQLEARVAVSTVDEVGARANLNAIGPLGFDAARTQADAGWNRLLSRIQINADGRTKRLFYSALYRTLLHPSNIADVDGRVRGPKGEVIQAPGGVYYSTLSLWDTFRASHPLFTLIVPERVPGFVSTLIAHQQQMGYLPLWTVMGRETHTMIGNPAMPVIADAIAKEFAVDKEAALQAMLATSTQDRPDAPAWAQRSWQLLDQHGYLPFDKAPGESVSKTAEYGYGDAALAQVARQMGRLDVAERFARRAGSWQNLFDDRTQTLRGKDSAGRWREPFDPVQATSPMNNPGDYTEANAYQYTATPALHDAVGFRDRLGGPEALGRWLDRFFALPVPKPDKHLGQEALIGQYAHGNEPSHHIAWAYAFSDRPEKGHARVAEVVRRFYSPHPDGIVGNDDAGQMSAWLVFAMLGFYPAEPASGSYVTGQPLLKGATLQLAGGKQLRIGGQGQRARLNGQPVARTQLTHRTLVQGGVLAFE